ncbi:hypothetical protein HN928_02045 [bacterium]|nr:hypothetical protein [bacterium]
MTSNAFFIKLTKLLLEKQCVAKITKQVYKNGGHNSMLNLKIVALRPPQECISNIGLIGKYEVDKGNRHIRYFSTDIYANAVALKAVLEEGFQQLNAHNMPRLMGRYIIDSSLDYQLGDTLALDCGVSAVIEARINLQDAFAHQSLIYVRIMRDEMADANDQNILEKRQSLLQDVQAKNCTIRPIDSGYTVERLKAVQATPQDIQDIIDIYTSVYQSYDITPENFQGNFQNSIVYVARESKSKHIVAIAAEERASIPIGSQKLTVCEIGRIATHKKHQGVNLAAHLTRCLYETVDIEADIDLVFAEARATVFGSNLIFHRLGFELSGTLEKYYQRAGSESIGLDLIRRKTGLEDFNIWTTIPTKTSEKSSSIESMLGGASLG